MSSKRRSAVNVPLFSLVSTHSWGLGEFLDLGVFVRWLQAAGQSAVQLLPITEMPPSERSPYSAMTSMALDPIYISMRQQEDFAAIGGELAFDAEDHAELRRLRSSDVLDYAGVRAFKDRWLRRGFDRFLQLDVARGSLRARRFDQFQVAEAWWLEDYATFRALHAHASEQPWWLWPEALAGREPRALAIAREELHHEITYRKYLQWVAAEQWADARSQCWPVAILGDLPFMISKDSPDVWSRQAQFHFDATVGAPPDAYSETGQDWGLPPWRWRAFVDTGFEWMKARARRNAALFDGLRLDHLVGLYRTYVRPVDKATPPYFAPGDEPTQTELGEALTRVFIDSGLEVIAEDLGTVPGFVRASIAALGVKGFKVMRWERHWQREGHPYIDPEDYPEVSVAMTGLHDLEPLAAWWSELPPGERAAVLAIPSVTRELASSSTGTPEDAMRSAILRSVLKSGSALATFPLQDLFGWRDRINTPATVGEGNWGWRVPWPVDTWEDRAEALDTAATLRAWTRAAGR